MCTQSTKRNSSTHDLYLRQSPAAENAIRYLPAMNNKSTLNSNLAIFGALALMIALLRAAAFNPQFPIWLAILVGTAIGCPLLFIGFRLHPGAKQTPNDGIGALELRAPDADASRQFWPTRTEIWGIAGLMTYFAAFSVASSRTQVSTRTYKRSLHRKQGVYWKLCLRIGNSWY